MINFNFNFKEHSEPVKFKQIFPGQWMAQKEEEIENNIEDWFKPYRLDLFSPIHKPASKSV